MKNTILFLLLILSGPSLSKASDGMIPVNFYGDIIQLRAQSGEPVTFNQSLANETVTAFYQSMKDAGFSTLVEQLNQYKSVNQLDDWLYYQLIRATAEKLSPKAKNYQQYTLYKWYLLVSSGYDATISIYQNKLLLYIQSDEEIFEVPYHTRGPKQYVCLNYHDYGEIDFDKEAFVEVPVSVPGSRHSFTYKITRLPDFKLEKYSVKNLQFDYASKEYQFKILVNEDVKKIFANYPVVDYSYYFNIPLSKTTYGSLIPLLKENIKKMKQVDGVDYLMRFTRYAFNFETDTKTFGKEKRLSPEQTLMYEYSDCEDRAAFFFYLVKEIYDLPMIVLSYPQHITIAVKFDKPVGKPIYYKGSEYSICEATPQRRDLNVGQTMPKLHKATFDVVYEYNPGRP